MFFTRKVIFHLFSLFERPEFSDDLIIGVLVLIISLVLAGFFVLIRAYIRSYISEIVNKELEKSPKHMEQNIKIENLIKKHEKTNNLLDEIFPRFPRLPVPREDMVYGLREAEKVYDLKKSVIEFDKEKGEIVFRVKLEDRFSPEELIEESENHKNNTSV